MDRSKLIVVLGIIGVLILVVWLLRAIFGGEDPGEIALRHSLSSQATIIEVSQQATTSSGDSHVQAIAASMASTTASDSRQLQSYYEARFGGLQAPADAEALQRFEDAGENLNQVFREVVHHHLTASLENLRTLRPRVSGEFGEVVDQAIENHESYLERIEP